MKKVSGECDICTLEVKKVGFIIVLLHTAYTSSMDGENSGKGR